MYMKNRTTYFYLSPTIDCFFNLQICFLFNRNRMNQWKKNFLEYQHFCLKQIFSFFSQKSDEFGWGLLSCTDSPDEGYKEGKLNTFFLNLNLKVTQQPVNFTNIKLSNIIFDSCLCLLLWWKGIHFHCKKNGAFFVCVLW